MTSSRRGGGSRDKWAEIVTRGDEEDQQHHRPAPKTQTAVVYGRRRAEDGNPRDSHVSKLDRENRVSLEVRKRTSWNRSLSIRGRESIVVAAAAVFRPQPKQRGQKKIPRPGQRARKAGHERPDFRREKEYFQEVDAFELIEESPSPKHFGTWVMGRQHDYQVHDLPGILERWKISKLAYSCQSSQQLFKILETSVLPSVQSSNGSSGGVNEKTPERTHASARLNLTSYEESVHCRPSNQNLTGGFDETSILTSLNSLHIKDENVVCDSFEDVEVSGKSDARKELEGAIGNDSFVLHSASLTGECLGAFAQLLMVCKQSAPVRLSEVFSTHCDPSSILKIGEGTYGEAFRAGEAVCKVVPIDGDLLVNGEVQKKSEEVLEEVLLSLSLNSLKSQQGETDKQNTCSSFIETKDFRVCKGTYDACLIGPWEDWDAKYGSENDHPSEFSEGQCYIVFVLADGGKDLESFVLLHFDEARSLLVQVTAALAVAESACEFEHRDLHWGNILLSRKEETVMDFTVEGRKMQAQTFGLKVSIIDFTLSRINTGEAILFLDLSTDPGIFEGPKGDKQSETYRKMKEVTEECWEGSFPKTNVLWLMYLVDILLMKKSFKRTTKDERDLRSLKKRLNSYSSAKDSLSDCFFSDLLVDLQV